MNVTREERRALEAVWRNGGSSKAVAVSLGKSQRTVEEQLARVRERMGVTTTMAAVREAIRSGLIEPT